MADRAQVRIPQIRRESLVISRGLDLRRKIAGKVGGSALFLITLCSALFILFIFAFIIRDAVPFFRLRGFAEFFTSTQWYPSHAPASFGALAIFIGSGLVTLGAVAVAVPLGVAAAVCLSDILPFRLRQCVKPVIEILAAIPSVAFGFFALVIFAPLLQTHGGAMLGVGVWVAGAPLGFLIVVLGSEVVAIRFSGALRHGARVLAILLLGGGCGAGLWWLSGRLWDLEVISGTNAFNVSILLGIMALPTVVSVSEDALQSVGRDLREGAYALGATRAETVLRVVIPAAGSGICAAVILGVMRAIGETMVVWMASGNAAHIPSPWYDLLEPIRTLTATIAGEMGEADQVTGSARYHVLFAMALCLLTVSYLFNFVSEQLVARSHRRRKKKR